MPVKSKPNQLSSKLWRFQKSLRDYGRAVTGRKFAARGLTVYPDDAFLVSFPRSGNTWARFIVSNLLDPEHPVTFATVDSRVPGIYNTSDRVLRALPRPRVIKSHECFDPRYRKVIYIVRDPRDVAVSYYEFQLKRNVIPEGYSWEEFMPRFMESEFEPTTGSWGDHVLSWLVTRHGRKDLLLLRYEDMLKETQEIAGKIAAFLGLKVRPEQVAQAVAQSSADRMRRLEMQQSRDWRETRRTRQDKPFVRKAMSGTWETVLPEASLAQIESAWGQVMRIVGYQLVTTSQPTSLPIPDAWLRSLQDRVLQ